MPAPFPIIGIFGGTFNPIHHGHLMLAKQVMAAIPCQEIRFVPAATPPHKGIPQVSAQHRAAMVALALQDLPSFKMDPCELARTGPSYTVDTLAAMRAQLPAHALCLIIGQDSYAQFTQWHAWQSITALAHLLVVHRAHMAPRLAIHAAHQQHVVPIVEAARLFASQPQGLVSVITTPPPAISSTQLRDMLQHGATQAALAPYLPASVIDYIAQHQLYTKTTVA